MTQQTTNPSNDEPIMSTSDDLMFQKKNVFLTEGISQETYVIKSFKDGKIEDAYDGILDFSTPEGKAEFNLLQKLISKNNWLVVPSSLFKQYEDETISLENLEEATTKNHEKLSLSKPNFSFIQAPKVNNDFISNVEDVQAAPEVRNLTGNSNPQAKTGVAAGEAVVLKPSEIKSSFDTTVKNKLNELNYHKSRLEKTKGKISIKSLALVGGIFAVGVLISPLLVITTPIAMAIGGYAILKGMFGKNPDIKSYDQQIEVLKEATARMVLKSTGEETKENVNNFVKNQTGLTGTLFDDKIEAEFARICKLRHIQVNRDVFKRAHLFEDGQINDYNRQLKAKAKM